MRGFLVRVAIAAVAYVAAVVIGVSTNVYDAIFWGIVALVLSGVGDN